MPVRKHHVPIFSYYLDVWQNRSKLKRQNYLVITIHTALLIVPSIVYPLVFRPTFFQLAGIYLLSVPLALWLYGFLFTKRINEYETAVVAHKSRSRISRLLYRMGNKIGNWESIRLADEAKIKSAFADSNHDELQFSIIGTLVASILLIAL